MLLFSTPFRLLKGTQHAVSATDWIRCSMQAQPQPYIYRASQIACVTLESGASRPCLSPSDKVEGLSLVEKQTAGGCRELQMNGCHGTISKAQR